MVKRYLAITEVSQKQAYIFSRNELRYNVKNSAAIAWITDPDYFRRAAGEVFNEAENLVYAGGGHSVLQFGTEEAAKEFCRKLTLKVHKEFPKMDLFTKIVPYREDIDLDKKNVVVKLDPNKKADEVKTNAANIRNLIAELEKKKAIHQSSFHQGTYGIEELDPVDFYPILPISEENKELEKMIWKRIKAEDRKVLPVGYEMPLSFEELGGSKGSSNFIAVVHIDGNGMGNRVLEYQKTLPGSPEKWDCFCKELKTFSNDIDNAFKEAFRDMNGILAFNLQKETSDEKNTDKKGTGEKNLLNEKLETLKDGVLPIRRIITSGDDICFVAEGRIGIECAAVFLEKLAAKEGKDKKAYAACAGVAIVHRSFPFYRAYDLAEQLCGNAKSVNATICPDKATGISSIDWHLEFGEMQDRLCDIRKEYETKDGMKLELRPYIVCEPDPVNSVADKRQYVQFLKNEKLLQEHPDYYSPGKVKELRGVLKQGKEKTEHYLTFSHMYDLTLESYQDVFKEIEYSMIGKGQGLEHKTFMTVPGDDKEHSILFDAIEVMDTFIPLERQV